MQRFQVLNLLFLLFITSACSEKIEPKIEKTKTAASLETRLAPPPPVPVPVDETKPESTDTQEENSADAGPVTKTPIMLEFTRDACMPCKIMVPWVEKLKKTYAGKLEVTEIDLDEPGNEKLGRYFRVNAVPSQVYIDKYGAVAAQNTGMARYHEMQRMVEQKLGIKE